VDLIEDIGPILGIVAFLGFAILALLIVLQAREVRRLREWAGRAPERALEADEAAQAAFEARGESDESEPGRLGAARARVAGALGPRWAALDRRSPVDPRWFLVVLLAGVIAAGVLTSGFGVLGDDGDGGASAGKDGAKSGQKDEEPKVTVAVLNATQSTDPEIPVEGVPGLADVVADQVVKPADFKVEITANAPAGEEQTVIMFEPEAEEDAQALATAVDPELGPTEAIPMTNDVRAIAKGALLALLIGQDDAEYGQTTTGTAVP
jgi:hypothetical protein